MTKRKTVLEKEIEALSRVNKFIASISNMHRLLDLIMEESKRIMNAEASSLMLYDPERKELFFEVALGKKGEKVKRIRLKLGQGIAGTAAKMDKVLNIPDVTKDPHFYKEADSRSGFKTKSILTVPLKRKGKL